MCRSANPVRRGQVRAACVSGIVSLQWEVGVRGWCSGPGLRFSKEIPLAAPGGTSEGKGMETIGTWWSFLRGATRRGRLRRIEAKLDLVLMRLDALNQQEEVVMAGLDDVL